MFELLFGQVTTILGELDDSKSATFEARVLEALFADDDVKMERLLGHLAPSWRTPARAPLHLSRPTVA